MSDESSDNESSARYYASKTEQKLLIWGLRTYFSFPERSSNRNRLASQVTAQLQKISPHWTHRAVRLWFNNNKKTFLNDNSNHFQQNMVNVYQQQPYVMVPQGVPPNGQIPMQNMAPPPQMSLLGNVNPAQNGPVMQNISGIPNAQQIPNATVDQKSPLVAQPMIPNIAGSPQMIPNMVKSPIVQGSPAIPVAAPIIPQGPHILPNIGQIPNSPIMQSPTVIQGVPTIPMSGSLTQLQGSPIVQAMVPMVKSPIIQGSPIVQTMVPMVKSPVVQGSPIVQTVVQMPVSPVVQGSPIVIGMPTMQSPAIMQSPTMIAGMPQMPKSPVIQTPPMLPGISQITQSPGAKGTPIVLPNISTLSNESTMQNESIIPNAHIIPNINETVQQKSSYVVYPEIRASHPSVSFETQQRVMPAIRVPPPKNASNIETYTQKGATDPTLYGELSTIIKQIRENRETDIAALRSVFDNRCQLLIQSEGSCSPEKINYRVPSIKIRSYDDVSNEDLLNGGPSDYNISQKSFSFSDLDNVIRQPSLNDITTTRPLFQERRYTEQIIPNYDNVKITDTFAAYTSNHLLSSKKSISFANLTEPDVWSEVQIPTVCPIDAFYVNPVNAWCYTENTLFRAKTNEPNIVKFQIPEENVRGAPYITKDTQNPDGVVISFSQSPYLHFANDDLIGQKTNYDGLMAVNCFNDNILCVPSDSFSIRQITRTGQEISSHIGHCNFVRRIISMNENSFISSSDDCTVRIWDKRNPLPSMQIHCCANCMCTDGNYVVIGLASKGISVVDVRAGAMKVCVTTQDYIADSVSYNAAKDELFMFGVIAREAGKDSMMFVDNNGNRKRVFRKYTNFIAN